MKEGWRDGGRKQKVRKEGRSEGGTKKMKRDREREIEQMVLGSGGKVLKSDQPSEARNQISHQRPQSSSSSRGRGAIRGPRAAH